MTTSSPVSSTPDVRRRTGAVLTASVVAHMLLISSQVYTATGRSALETVAFGALGEVQRVTGAAWHGVVSTWNGYVRLRSVWAENVALRAQLANAEIRLQEQRALALSSERLEAILELRRAQPQRSIAARIIAGDATSWFRTVTIDRGSDDGVSTDAAVVSPRGVVGRVVGRPAARAARVQLLIDRNAGVGAVIERSRVGGVVVADDGEMLRMEYVSNLADVRVGDLAVTSGLDGIFPKGFVVGTVASVERDHALHHVITLRPAVDFAALEEVVVLLDPPAAALDAATVSPAGGGE